MKLLRKNIKYKPLILAVLILVINFTIISSWFAYGILNKESTTEFDSKLQLNEFITSNAGEIKDVKAGIDLDNDGLDNIVIAHDKMLTIYEKVSDKFELVWQIRPGSINFTDSNSTLTSVSIGDLNNNGLFEIIVGSNQGEICILSCIDSVNTNYTAKKRITYNSYDSTVPESYRSVDKIICKDLNNDGDEEILFGNSFAAIYALNRTHAFEFEKLYLDYRDGDNNGIKWVLKPGSQLSPAIYNQISDLDLIEISENITIIFIGTKENFYTIKYDVNDYGFAPRMPVEITLLNDEVREIMLKSLDDDSEDELIVATRKDLYIYGIIGQAYESISNYDLKEKNEEIVETGSEIKSISVGDYNGGNDRLIALGTQMTSEKIRLFTDISSEDQYWNSQNFITDDIVLLDTIFAENGRNDLFCATKNYVYIFSEDFADTDKDRLSDLSEQAFYFTESDNADTDNDGVDDGLEVFVFQTDPINLDTDNDLVSDGIETNVGTNPLDPMSSMTFIILVPSLITIISISLMVMYYKYAEEKRKDYEKVEKIPNLVAHIKLIISQRIETFAKNFNGFSSKKELKRFDKNLADNLFLIVEEGLNNFLDYLRLKGITFDEKQEEIYRKIAKDKMESLVKAIGDMNSLILLSETRYQKYPKELMEFLATFYEDWKASADVIRKKSKGIIKCRECGAEQPRDSAFCLDCGAKLLKD